MTDVQIFCIKESKILQEKLNASVKRAVNLLHSLPEDKVFEGNKQLDKFLSDLDDRLKLLTIKKQEEKLIGDKESKEKELEKK